MSEIDIVLAFFYIFYLVEAFFSLSAISSCIPFISSEEEEETGEVFGTILTYLIQLRDTLEDTETLYLFEW